MTEQETIEEAKRLMAEVYKCNFNIYACLNKLKKKLKLTEDFPAQAIVWTCENYLRSKEPIQNHWSWFLEVFKRNSKRYFSELNEKESIERHKTREGASEAIKEIMRKMF